MSFSYRYRKPISIVALAAMFVATAVTPVTAEYNPRLGRFMQADPNGTGLVLTSGLSYHGSNPTVTVSMAYELQYGDGMNFYEYLRSNPPNRTDPSGLSSLLENAWFKAQSNWAEYLKTDGGRAWTRRIDGVADAFDIFSASGNAFDDDIYEAIGSLQTNRIETLQRLEKASFELRYGHKTSMLFAAGSFAWDDVVWEPPSPSC